jgi:hypothetical protein
LSQNHAKIAYIILKVSWDLVAHTICDFLGANFCTMDIKKLEFLGVNLKKKTKISKPKK